VSHPLHRLTAGSRLCVDPCVRDDSRSTGESRGVR